MNNKFGHILIISLIFCSQTFGMGNTPSKRVRVPSQVASVTWAKQALQGYNLRVWLSNQMVMGEEAWNPHSVPDSGCTAGIGMEYPAGSCVEHLFGTGPIFGGIIEGIKHVTAGYNADDALMEFLPESKDTLRDKIWQTNTGPEVFHPNGNGYSGYYYNHTIVVNRRGFDDDGDGKIDEDELDGQDNDGDWNPLTDDIGADGLPDSLEVSCNGKRYDALTNPDPAYDNYDPAAYDSCHIVAGIYPTKSDKYKYTQNNGIPDHGEPHVDEDYGAISDNDLYMAATDTFTSVTIPGHFPMGIKVFQKTYAWNNSQLDAFIPMDYIFVNVGKHTIDSVFIAFWADFDVGPVSVAGYYSQNYACYSPPLHCGYVDNPTDSGSTPGGLALLGTPRSLDSLNYVWAWQIFFSNPDSVLYMLMNGQSSGGVPIHPCQSPSAPTDTRFFYSFGPFQTMRPGDSLKISVALISGSSLADMFNNAGKAHDLYANNFVLGVKDKTILQPADFRLEQNYPNPFNPSTSISYSIPHQTQVKIEVYNILGQLVAELVNEHKFPGNYIVDWDANGKASGVYFYRMLANGFTQTKRLLLIK